MKNQQNIIVIAFLIFIVTIVIISIYTDYNRYELTKETLLNIEKHTRVMDIYINKKEHNFVYVKYSNGKSESLDDPYKIGDSISKKRGDSIEYIFRKGKIIQNNLLENYRKSTNYKYLRAKSVTLSCK